MRTEFPTSQLSLDQLILRLKSLSAILDGPPAHQERFLKLYRELHRPSPPSSQPVFRITKPKSRNCRDSKDFLRCLIVENMLREEPVRLSPHELVQKVREVTGKYYNKEQVLSVIADIEKFSTQTIAFHNRLLQERRIAGPSPQITPEIIQSILYVSPSSAPEIRARVQMWLKYCIEPIMHGHAPSRSTGESVRLTPSAFRKYLVDAFETLFKTGSQRYSRFSYIFQMTYLKAFIAVCVICVAQSGQPDRVRSENLIALSAFSRSLGTSSLAVMHEINKDLPDTQWTLVDVDRLRNHVLSGARVPEWLHQILDNYPESETRPLDHSNQDLVNRIKRAAPSTELRWQSDKFVKFVVRQWLTYCIKPTRRVRDWPVKLCRPRVFLLPHGMLETYWELSKDSLDSLTLEMNVIAYNQQEAVLRNRALPTVSPNDVDILDYSA